MQNGEFDVAVIGTGPGGCVAATFLAMKGYRVVMMEREKFPRFHIGESLLPGSQEIWERLGIADEMQHSGHTFKYAGSFHIAPYPDRPETISTTTWSFNFPRKMMNPRQYAYHVERAVFDKQLQDNAVRKGVTLWENTAVQEVMFEGERAVGVKYKREDNPKSELRVPFVIDASGRRCMVAKQLDCIEMDPEIKTSSVFSHFRGVQREPGYRQGFFNGYFVENGWIWLIPLHNDVMSVGLVQNEPETDSWSNDPEEVLRDAISRYKPIRDRFKDAVQVGRARSLKGLAYSTEKFCGDGWLSVGDANFFVDPLYSSGVQIAHTTAEKAADVVDTFLKNDRCPKAISSYEKYIKRYRRNVIGPMRALYRMMQHYRIIAFYVRSTGPWSNDYQTWFLRRINCWGSGYFHHYNWVSRILEYFGKGMSAIYPSFMRLADAEGWKRYERNPCKEPRLEIPREPGPMMNEGSSDAAASESAATQQSHPEPADPAVSTASAS